MSITILVGTVKGAWVLRADDARADWSIEGPLFKGWKVTAATRDARGRYVVATASDVYGPAIHVSEDCRSWTQIDSGPAWEPDSGRKLTQLWTLHARGELLLAGVDEAGLFRSEDGGATWDSVTALNEHPTRGGWYPGFGGLCLHSILTDPKDPQRIWVGISAVGVFRSDDGGASWVACNGGIPVILEDKAHSDIGFCVHGLAADPDEANRIYRQDHVGMFRSTDGGDSWERCEEGLPSGFGFPVEIDARTRSLFVVPLEADQFRFPVDGAFRVYRSADGGDRWHELGDGALPVDFYGAVLRGGMAVDACDPAGVYVGTTAGTVHLSADLGDTWQTLPTTLPRILMVEAFTDG